VIKSYDNFDITDCVTILLQTLAKHASTYHSQTVLKNPVAGLIDCFMTALEGPHFSHVITSSLTRKTAQTAATTRTVPKSAANDDQISKVVSFSMDAAMSVVMLPELFEDDSLSSSAATRLRTKLLGMYHTHGIDITRALDMVS
jgi:hypothetical protein